MSRKVQIESLKADKQRHRLWKENFLLYQDEGRLIGYNHNTVVEQWDGKVVTTYQPALFYFEKDAWFNVVYIMDQNLPFFYCNLSSPMTFDGQLIQYIDYDIDIVVKKDYSFEIMDEDEFSRHKNKYHYDEAVVKNIQMTKEALIKRVKKRQTPFNDVFLAQWLNKIANIMHNRGK